MARRLWAADRMMSSGRGEGARHGGYPWERGDAGAVCWPLLDRLLMRRCRKSLLDETTRELNTDKNNADLIDDEANQGLTASDIAALKSEAKAPDTSLLPSPGVPYSPRLFR